MAKHSTSTTARDWGQRVLALLLAGLLALGVWGAITLVRDRGADDRSTAQDDPTDGPGTSAAGDDAAGDGAAASSAAPASASSGADGGTATSAAPVAAADDCEPVAVWVAPAVAPAVQAAADRAGDDCFSYVVAAKETGPVQAALAAGEDVPAVWVPDSEAWPLALQAEGAELELGETVASSPVFLAGDRRVVGALDQAGIEADASWKDMVASWMKLVSAGGEPPVAMRVGDPRTDPASMALFAASDQALGGWAKDESGRDLLVLLAQTAVQGDPMSALAGGPTIVPATEQQIAGARVAGAELAGFAPSEGAGTVRMPFVRVGGADTGAVDALEAELTSEAAAADLAQLALRPGEDGPAPGVEGVPEEVVTAATPRPEQVGTLLTAWRTYAPHPRILTLIDISGSMDQQVGDGMTRIDLTREAARTALARIPESTALGTWYFSSVGGRNEGDYTPVVPVRPLSEKVRGGGTQKDLLLREINYLTADNLGYDTALHDTLWAGYEEMQDSYQEGYVSSVLLLTDGKNDDPKGGLSEKALIERLSKAYAESDPERRVTVVLIGMGPDVDEAALQRIAEAAGGESLVLSDPRELPKVLVEVVAKRAP